MSFISLQMYTMRDYTKTKEALCDTVEKLREIGFQFLQYTVPGFLSAKEVKKIFDENKIKNDSVFCPAFQIENNQKEILSQCDLFETKYLRIDSIPRDLISPVGFKMYAHYLNELKPLFASQKIKILYHFHSFEFVNFEQETGLDIFLRETDPEFIAIQPDTHWIAAGGINPADFITAHKDRIVFIHAKDYAIGLREPLLESTPERFAEIGKGNLNWEAILKASEGVKHLLYVIEQDNCYGKNPFDCVKTSFDHLKSLGIK
jgi:Xylose isomerase-like TIM barrel.